MKDGEIMLIDLHAHSSGISKCCRISGEEVVDLLKEKEIDGIILTNHYQKNYLENYDHHSFAKRYVEEYKRIKEYGQKKDIKVFFGIEVTLDKHSNTHVLIYGVSEDFILKYSDIFDYTLENLYKLVKENNGILIQAHPFRNNGKLLDLNYLDGVEVNSHPLYEGTHYKELIQIAKENNKLVTSGGDYHADTYRPKCGIYMPDYISNSIEFTKYLKECSTIKLCIQEVDGSTPFIYNFNK